MKNPLRDDEGYGPISGLIRDHNQYMRQTGHQFSFLKMCLAVLVVVALVALSHYFGLDWNING